MVISSPPVGSLPARSYRYCQRIARRSGSSFTFTYHLLPRRQRLAMYALYAFMRQTDDLADADGPTATKRSALAVWREQLDAALTGDYAQPLHAALHHAVRSYGIPPQHLHEVIDGVEMDLDPLEFVQFEELYRYCYRVASAVGLCCIPIWGYRGSRATEYAEAAGIAFQLTNILRDLGEDAARGRVYLPREDWQRFAAPPASWRDPQHADRFRDLMRFEVQRARHYYEASAPLRGLLSSSGAAIFGVMSATYRGLLEAIEARGYDVFSSRVRLSRWRKIGLLMGALPVCWGVWPR